MFGKRLAQTRKNSGYTQVEIAEALGVSKGTVAMWETEKREPQFATLKRLSVLLNCSIDWLLQDY
ncbi:MAG: helix-turn-helix transcriptional regulator [Oscillospiraceae bacterium]|nr:helix-turn-helix transcriptional regulator [Oscillospiraceae bacterium]